MQWKTISKSKHTIVCHASQKNWAHAALWEQSHNFTQMYIIIRMMPNINSTKFTVEVPSTQGKPHLKFKDNPLTILEIQAIKFSKKYSSFFFFSYT